MPSTVLHRTRVANDSARQEFSFTQRKPKSEQPAVPTQIFGQIPCVCRVCFVVFCELAWHLIYLRGNSTTHVKNRRQGWSIGYKRDFCLCKIVTTEFYCLHRGQKNGATRTTLCHKPLILRELRVGPSLKMGLP